MENTEVVISGISGHFPQCESFNELKEALTNARHLGKICPRKWPKEYHNLKAGVITNHLQFDNTFFGVSRSVGQVQDPTTRKLLESTFQCMIDAGINPSNMRNSKTPVIMVTSKSDWDLLIPSNRYMLNSHTIMGRSKAMDANRVSFSFDFVGASYTMGSSESGGIGAIHEAVQLIKHGYAKQVLVGGSRLLVSSLGFRSYNGELHLFSNDGETRSFSDDASGFWQSEGIVVLLLQRKQDAQRIYATIDKSAFANFTDSSRSPFFDHTFMKEFLKDFYKNENVDDIGLVVGEGVGLPVLDAIEINSIASAFEGRRKEPLLVTSCKSLMGHAGGCSSFFSVLTAIITLQTNTVIPITNYGTPNRSTPSLVDGSVRIPNKLMKFNGEKIAVNAFGTLSGDYGHIILSRPKITCQETVSKIPYGIAISGRSDEKLREVFKLLEQNATPGAVALTQKIFSQPIHNYTLRAFGVVSSKKPIMVQKYDLPKPKPVWFIYSGMGSQWKLMGRDLMQIELFAKSARKLHEVLKEEGIDFLKILTSDDPDLFTNIIDSFVGITGMQIILTDILAAVGVKPDGIIGHSLGELSCAYADGCCTQEEAILASLARGRASVEADLVPGMMAAVGMGYNKIKDKLPEGIEVACHNSSTNCTLSGPTELMKKCVEELQSQNVFTRLVNVNNIAYHSKYIIPAAPILRRSLEKVLSEPKKRSPKWISTSVPEDKWDSPEAQMSSITYFTNNLLNSVYFEEGCKHIPDDAICIEIGPHGLLQAIVKRSLPQCVHIPLTNKASVDKVDFLLNAFGTMYVNGINVDFEKLYPPIEFPVPHNTWSTQQLATWQFEEKWNEESFDYSESDDEILLSLFTLDPDNIEHYKIKGSYVVNKKSIVPPMYILGKVIKMFHRINCSDISTTPLLLQDLEIHEIEFPDEKLLGAITMLRHGRFEVVLGENKSAVVCISGTIEALLDSSNYISHSLPYIPNENHVELSHSEIYSCLEDYNYYFEGPFKNLNSITLSDKGYTGEMKILGDLEYQLDAMLSSAIVHSLYENGSPVYVSKILSIAIDPKLLTYGTVDSIAYEALTNRIAADGINITNVTLKPLNCNIDNMVEIKKNCFLPYHTYQPKDEIEFYDVCSQFIVENTPHRPNDFTKTVKSIVTKNSGSIPTQLNQFLNRAVLCEVMVLTLSEIVVECKALDCCYVVTLEGTTIPERLINLLSTTASFIFLHVPAGLQATLPNDIITVYSYASKHHYILLLKKKQKNVNLNTIVKTSNPNWEQVIQTAESNGPQFVIMENMLLAEVSSTIDNISRKAPNNTRFLSFDKKSPAFDIKFPVYHDVMRNDFKVAISQAGVFGSIRNLPVRGWKEDARDSKALLINQNNKNRNLEIKAVGLSFSEPTKPSPCSEPQTFEFSGVKDGKAVMGLCEIIDGILKIDDTLIWETPSNWSPQQAVTIPLYYSMAYYVLFKVGLSTKDSIIFIHAGYSLLSQAFIRVAVNIGSRVITTYFTKEQKNFISSTFPELPKEDIIECNKTRCSMEVMMKTNGHGANLAVNTLGSEYVEYCMELLYSEVDNRIGGRMVQVSEEPMSSNYNFGMEVFFKKSGVYGLVNREVFMLSKDDKEWIKRMIADGIKSRTVKPLDFVTVDFCLSSSQIYDIALSSAISLPMKKAVISFGKSLSSARLNRLNLKKSILLVGTQNALCCDIINCYVSKGYRTFHLFLDKESISPVLSRRLKILQKRNYDLVFEFHPMNILNSAHDCEILIQHIQKDSTLEHVIHISSDQSNTDCNHLDTALRKFAKDVTFISVGKFAQKLCEIRRKDGYDSIAFLHASNLSNRVIAHGIEKMVNSLDGSISTIYLESSENKVMKEPKMVKSCLPADIKELLELKNLFRHEEQIVPLATRGTDYNAVKDATPLIVLPGFRINKVANLVSSLPYPGYVVTIPMSAILDSKNNLSDIALMLSQDIIDKFPTLRVVTLVCEGWSTKLALLVTRFLELRNRKCVIFMLNAPPSVLKESYKSITDLSIIAKYFDLSLEMLDKLKNIPKWEEKVKEVINLLECSTFDKSLLEICLFSLRQMVLMFKEFESSKLCIKGKVILITSAKDMHEFDCGDLQLCCSSKVIKLQVASDDSICQETVDKLVCYPPPVNNDMDLSVVSVEELTSPVYSKDLPTRELHKYAFNDNFIRRLYTLAVMFPNKYDYSSYYAF